MRLQQKHAASFAEYEKFWRRVLMDVLEWPESKFARFILRRKAALRRQGGKKFFGDGPFKHFGDEIVPERLKNKFPRKHPVEFGLIDAIAGEFKGNDATIAKYGLLGTILAAYYKSICSPSFDIRASRSRYRKQIERLDCAVVRTANEEQRAFGEYKEVWRRALVDVLGWSDDSFRRFVSRERGELREWGGDTYFHDPAYKYILPKLLPESLRRKIAGVDRINAERRLMRAIAGSASPYPTLHNEEFDIDSARRRYFDALEHMEKSKGKPKE